MKKYGLLLLLFAFLFLNAGNSNAQCTPDTVTCTDTLLPGQICPEILPGGYLGIAYNQTVTILPPSSAIFSDIGFTIFKIRIDTITNLPPGIEYDANATDLYPDTAYCILLSGVPTETGEFNIIVNVIPYLILLDSVVEAPIVINDTSVRIIIDQPIGIRENFENSLHLIEFSPNPFHTNTKPGFTIDESAEVKLSILDFSGRQVYNETMNAIPGRNYFRFTGESIKPGYYIFSVWYKNAVYSDRLIKLE